MGTTSRLAKNIYLNDSAPSCQAATRADSRGGHAGLPESTREAVRPIVLEWRAKDNTANYPGAFSINEQTLAMSS